MLLSVLMQVSEKQELITLYEGDSEVARHKELKTANDRSKNLIRDSRNPIFSNEDSENEKMALPTSSTISIADFLRGIKYVSI